jgi:hypothetical protein
MLHKEGSRSLFEYPGNAKQIKVLADNPAGMVQPIQTADDWLYSFSGSSPKTAYRHRGLLKPDDPVSNNRLA